MSDPKTSRGADNVTSLVPANPTDAERREALRARIEAGERRQARRTLAEQAKEAGDSALEFTRKYPIAVVGGAILAGLAIGAMTRPGRRLGRRGGVLATLALDAALAYGARILDQAGRAAQTAGERFEDLGDSASTAARGIKRDARYKFDVASDALRANSRKAARKGSRAAKAVRTRLAP